MPVNYNFTATSEKKNKRHMAEHFSGWKKKKKLTAEEPNSLQY